MACKRSVPTEACQIPAIIAFVQAKPTIKRLSSDYTSATICKRQLHVTRTNDRSSITSHDLRGRATLKTDRPIHQPPVRTRLHKTNRAKHLPDLRCYRFLRRSLLHRSRHTVGLHRVVTHRETVKVRQYWQIDAAPTAFLG